MIGYDAFRPTPDQPTRLADEIEAYATTLEDIAERWGHAGDAHTRQIARRLRVILAKHAGVTEGEAAS